MKEPVEFTTLRLSHFVFTVSCNTYMCYFYIQILFFEYRTQVVETRTIIISREYYLVLYSD